MPKVLLSFDAHSPNSKGRPTFEAALQRRNWIDFIIQDDQYYELPDTTFVSNRSLSQISEDLDYARDEAVKVDMGFSITRCIISKYEWVLAGDVNGQLAKPAQITSYGIAMSGM